MIDTSNKEIQSHYDFIVVGAGAAGSVIAAELSVSGAQVLVVESGGPDDAPTIANPSVWFYNVGGPLDPHGAALFRIPSGDSGSGNLTPNCNFNQMQVWHSWRQ
jgi:choline dehydrogenase-like flavoprotein